MPPATIAASAFWSAPMPASPVTIRKYDANLDFCKGCGICAYECPVDDIDMVLEVK